MTLTTGTKLGAFEIAGSLGAGGMGEVYRARDTRLDREVAIKILPRPLALDAERVARFQREARTLALLNHPNIAGIYGIEETNGVAALVLELVEGDDLSQRLARGPIPGDEALAIARQIAAALEAAHQQGIIHRDLKPGNIKIRPDGTVKLLDFGLAKVLDTSDSGTGGSHAPTMTSDALTLGGAVLGTAAYMSPEQARGRPVDKRTDVWAFGCVLFEMLAGRRAFPGESQSDVLAAILMGDPDLTALPADTPPAIRRLLRRCLQKDPADRLRDIGDACLEIRDADVPPQTESAMSRTPARRSLDPLAWTLAMLSTIVAVWLALRPAVEVPQRRVDLVTPDSPSTGSIALSPDGEALALVVSSDGVARLWLRGLRSGTFKPLPGTEGGSAPFWSPDGRALGFFAHGKLRRIDVDSGSIRTLTNATTGTSGTWGARNIVLFASRGNPLMQVSADGGETSVLQGVRAGSNFSPAFLPDGRRFLYYRRAGDDTRGIYVGDLDAPGSEAQRLVDAQGGAVYSPSGHLLFTLHDTLLAQPFDPGSLTLGGSPLTLGTLENWETTPGITAAPGVIAYRPNVDPHRQLRWFDRTGRELEVLGQPGETFSTPSLSRDGQQVLFYRALGGNVDIWVLDTQRGVLQRLTTHPADDVGPVWSPDGKRIAFSSTRSGTLEIYTKPATVSGVEELLFEAAGFKAPTDWSADGSHLLFNFEGEQRSQDVWAVSLETRRPFPVVQSAEFHEHYAQFSPDGRWIAYQSDESGRPEIYLQSFPQGGTKLLVSTHGGTQARFRQDGRELFYLSSNGDLMAVPLVLPTDGRPPLLGSPLRLFTPSLAPVVQLGEPRHQYMVSADGLRFLVVAVEPAQTPPVSLILNWKPER